MFGTLLLLTVTLQCGYFVTATGECDTPMEDREPFFLLQGRTEAECLDGGSCWCKHVTELLKKCYFKKNDSCEIEKPLREYDADYKAITETDCLYTTLACWDGSDPEEQRRCYRKNGGDKDDTCGCYNSADIHCKTNNRTECYQSSPSRFCGVGRYTRLQYCQADDPAIAYGILTKPQCCTEKCAGMSGEDLRDCTCEDVYPHCQ